MSTQESKKSLILFMKKDSCKICRRLGQKLFLKGERCFSPKCSMVRRAYTPGEKKKQRRRGISDYGLELREKQKLKNWYNVKEYQFKKYVGKALAKKGKVQNLPEEFIKQLEMRLDNVIFRMNLSPSRRMARQMVSHGFFIVNGRSVDIPSFEVKKGDRIAVKENKKKKGVFKEILNNIGKTQFPSWIKFDVKKLEAEIIGEPSLEEALPPADILTIFEFYSK
jgi:small subunit ribosomal protein S4